MIYNLQTLRSGDSAKHYPHAVMIFPSRQKPRGKDPQTIHAFYHCLLEMYFYICRNYISDFRFKVARYAFLKIKDFLIWI
jgi:hypothetical protein